jgi:ADP-ribose pyrophosphatase YjhB (NUDIX family)
MKYCSECGMQVRLRWMAEDRRERYVCTSCGRVHYQNPRVLVACALFWRDKLLLSRRAHEPARGKWIIPSGFLECGETLQEAAARETFEETGVIVDPAKLELYSVMNIAAMEQVFVSFRAQLSAQPVVRPGSECLEVALMSEEDIPMNEFAWTDSLGNAPRRLFEQIRMGSFAIYLSNVESPGKGGFVSREYPIEARASAPDIADQRSPSSHA